MEAAERLYREIGFQKTTVADIARELRMSPANVYRFFGSKAEINGAVANHVLSSIVAASVAIVEGPGTASERLRALVKNNETMNAERFVGERKLHEMVEVALNDDWPIVTEYVQTMRMLMGRLVAEGTLGELRTRAGKGQGTLEEVFLDIVSEETPQETAASKVGAA